MPGYLLETSVLSVYLDPSDPRHLASAQALAGLPTDSVLLVSAIALAEIEFGVRVARMVSRERFAQLEQVLEAARRHFVIDVTKQTAQVYADIKSKIAHKFLASTLRKDRPKYIEDWIDRTTGKSLDIDENDLWMCAQAKERDLTLVTAERRMQRIKEADPDVQLLRI